MDEQDSMLEIVDGAVNVIPKVKNIYVESEDEDEEEEEEEEEDRLSDQHGKQAREKKEHFLLNILNK